MLCPGRAALKIQGILIVMRDDAAGDKKNVEGAKRRSPHFASDIHESKCEDVDASPAATGLAFLHQTHLRIRHDK